jgi:hypothetical protein
MGVQAAMSSFGVVSQSDVVAGAIIVIAIIIILCSILFSGDD